MHLTFREVLKQCHRSQIARKSIWRLQYSGLWEAAVALYCRIGLRHDSNATPLYTSSILSLPPASCKITPISCLDLVSAHSISSRNITIGSSLLEAAACKNEMQATLNCVTELNVLCMLMSSLFVSSPIIADQLGIDLDSIWMAHHLGPTIPGCFVVWFRQRYQTVQRRSSRLEKAAIIAECGWWEFWKHFPVTKYPRLPMQTLSRSTFSTRAILPVPNSPWTIMDRPCAKDACSL